MPRTKLAGEEAFTYAYGAVVKKTRLA
jgi:hypothetical protein